MKSISALHNLSLRTQFSIAVAFLFVFAIGAGFSNWIGSRNRSDAMAILNRDIAISTKLPKLKSLLRDLDQATAYYLRTGREDWLREHRDTIEKLHRTQADLTELLPDRREKRILEELDRQLAGHFIEESRWIRQKRSGQLSAAEAERIISGRRSYEDILNAALGMHEIDIQRFPERASEAREASRNSAGLVLVVGLGASFLLTLALSRYVFEPIRSLAEYAKSWKPGEPWTCDVPSVSPEIKGLFRDMRNLMDTLNAEYRKEKDTARMKSQLVSMVSHELNNSLSVIHAASATLEETDSQAEDPRREKMYRILRGQTLSLSRTIGNLLNFGRLESGKLALRKRQMDMAAVLLESVDLLELLYQNKGLKVSLSLPDAPLSLYADPDALSLVVTNLLINAIKYTPEGGSIWIGINQEPKEGEKSFARIYVRDTGIGITPEEREKIFSGYYRSERGQKLAKGFGIGLSLVKTIIEAHGGRLELESEPGKGSTFSFLLPLWISGPEADGIKEVKTIPVATVMQPGAGGCVSTRR